MSTRTQVRSGEKEELPLHRAVEYLIEECRMVLPGIQTLFGFQLIAVFNEGFARKLPALEQRLHLVSVGLVAIAIALIMSPAAFHRQTGPREVSDTLVRLSTRVLLWSMFPLALGISIEFYIVSRIVLGSALVAIPAVLLFGVFVTMWFVLPRTRSLQRLIAGTRG
jgi:hypothetical protein